MSKTTETGVLIVGAGPVGMVAALALRRAGAQVTIIDKRPRTREYSQAAIIWPRTFEIFDLLGIVEDWMPRSLPIHAFAVNVDGHHATLRLESTNSPHPFPRAVGQDITEAILQKHLERSGAVLRRSVEATALKLSANGAEAVVVPEGSEPEFIRSKWIVGCDGSSSLVREAAGLQRKGERNAGVQIVQGDVRIRGPLALAPDRAYLMSEGERNSLFMLPASVDGHYRVLVTVEDNGDQDPPSLGDLQTLVNRFVPGTELYDPVWLNRFRAQHQLAENFRHGRAFVAGDAAHTWIPIGGQGMNIGIQDAFDLGWKLGDVVRGVLDQEALNTYSEERRPISQTTIEATERIYKAMLDPKSMAAQLGRKLFPHLVGLHAVGSFLSERFGQMDFHYRASSLVSDRGGTNGSKAGERAPDAWVTKDGKTIRLYDLYRAGRWLMLRWVMDHDNAPAPWPPYSLSLDTVVVDCRRHGATAEGNIVRDVGRLAAEAFGISGEAVHIIRPDGVIGYRGPSDLAQVSAYLRGVFTDSLAN